MSLALVHTRAKFGIDAPAVTVEVHLSNGLPGLNIVGLPEAAVKESKDRVRSALINSQFEFPTRRITVSLAPADLPKEGGRFELPIAMGILVASGQLPQSVLEEREFIGELGLSGDLRPVTGVLPAALACHAQQRTLALSAGNGSEASLCDDLPLIAAPTLLALCNHLSGQTLIAVPTPMEPPIADQPADLAEVKGQLQARRALEIAAAGQHNLLMCGPPGAGKTMLASRLPSILPPLSRKQALSSAAIYSVAGQTANHWQQPPFRAPHHTASAVALVGGGAHPKPGEISLAHEGVLFLDELPEFPRTVLEVLRQPLESGHINISRASFQVTFPARFQFIAAMNPCPCGYFGEPRCRCTPDQVRRYRNRVSGPLLDRLDLHINVSNLKPNELHQAPAGESSTVVRQRVLMARQRQQQRQGKPNVALNVAELDALVPIGDRLASLLSDAIQKLGLSARAYHRTIRVARTIADLADAEQIEQPHLLEAISYRQWR